MFLESLRGKDDSIDLSKENSLIEYNPAAVWILVILHKRISPRLFNIAQTLIRLEISSSEGS